MSDDKEVFRFFDRSDEETFRFFDRSDEETSLEPVIPTKDGKSEPIDPSSKFAEMFNEFLLKDSVKKNTSLEKKVPTSLEKKELPRGWKCNHKSLGGHFSDYEKSGGRLDWCFFGTLEEVKGHADYNTDAEALEEYVMDNSFNIEDVFFTKSSN
jgi:hypothetical protein